MPNRHGREIRKLLINRDGPRIVCAYCGRAVAHADVVGEHATPLSRGGVDKMSNIVSACRQCDQLKGPLTAEEFRSVMKDHAARKALIKSVHAELRVNPPRLKMADRRRSR